MKFVGRLLSTAAVIVLGVLIMAGCGRLDAPTASQPTTEDGMGLWNPSPGDHVVPGREIPLLQPGYWESHYGLEVNPWLNAPASAVIGPDGGSLVLGGHRLDVPRGALARPITFTLSYASRTAIAVDCGPSGLTFDVPVTLTLSYAGTQYENSDRQSDLKIFYMSPIGNTLEMPSEVNQDAKTVSAQLNHFSRYIIS